VALRVIGLIPHLALGFIRQQRGDAAVEASLRAADLPGDHQFYIDRPYDDDTWQRLFAAGAAELGLDLAAFDYQFGRYVADDLAGRFPGFFVGVSDLRGMLLRQIQIHYQLARSMRDPEMRRLVAQKFELVEDGEVLTIRYRSPNDHLNLYRGAAHRLAELLGERIEIAAEDRRTDAGADYLLRMTFHGRAPAGASV
jgi:hypothetical protein